MLKYTIFFLLLVSCNFTEKGKIRKNDINQSDVSVISNDTLIKYDIEGISTEGTEAEVRYVNGKIAKSTTSVYGETGQANIIYEFDSDRIKVLETKYSYLTGLANLKSDKDIKLEYKISYSIDLKGHLIGKEIPVRIDIFNEFKNTVPFELK
ncbi:hypothetical protein ACR79T_14145 [Sphingobacterium spiritivorum]|uniref:hypothetical protein n=1 Tax=Sphingobacterium spiritivorum TaxID=258 RepID=UPI003DA57258